MLNGRRQVIDFPRSLAGFRLFSTGLDLAPDFIAKKFAGSFRLADDNKKFSDGCTAWPGLFTSRPAAETAWSALLPWGETHGKFWIFFRP